jgi:hypothetical protein
MRQGRREIFPLPLPLCNHQTKIDRKKFRKKIRCEGTWPKAG